MMDKQTVPTVSPPRYLGDVQKDVQRKSYESFLDLSRWLAASIVLVSHLRDPLFLVTATSPPPTGPSLFRSGIS
jgi:hypothetical protein